MINKFTLSISGIAIPDETLDKLCSHFSFALLSAFIFACLGTVADISHIVYRRNSPNAYDVYEITQILIYSLATDVFLLIGWILTKKLKKPFPGLAVLIVGLVIGTLTEKLTSTHLDCKALFPMYFFIGEVTKIGLWKSRTWGVF